MSSILPISTLKQKAIVGTVYGRPGVGKTSLLSGLNNSVVIGTERNSNIDCLGHPDGVCKTYSQFLKQFEWAYNLPNDVCKNIIIDTVSEVETLMAKSFFKKSTDNLNTCLGGYGTGREELYKTYFNFFKEHVNKAIANEKNVIFIARVDRREELDEETGSSFTRTYPKIEKNKCYEFFAGEMDFIFSIKAVAPSETGVRKTEGFCIYTRPSAGSDAKNRFNLKPMYFINYFENIEGVKKAQKELINQIFSDIFKNVATPPPTKEKDLSYSAKSKLVDLVNKFLALQNQADEKYKLEAVYDKKEVGSWAEDKLNKGIAYYDKLLNPNN